MAIRLKDRIEANIRQSDKVNNSLSINGKTFNGSAAVNVGAISVAYGGTGATTLSSKKVLFGNGTSAIKTYDMHINYSAGTASTIGYEELVVGNSTASGTAGNTYGRLALYSSGTKGQYIVAAANSTDWTTHTLPVTGGTLLNTGTTSWTAADVKTAKVGTLKLNGTNNTLYDVFLYYRGANFTDNSITDLNNVKVPSIYYSNNSTETGTLTNAPPGIGSGFRLITLAGYQGTSSYGYQLAFASQRMFWRKLGANNTDASSWYGFIPFVAGTAIGSANKPIYLTDIGTPTACNTFVPNSGGTFSGTVIFSRTQDASGTADNGPAVVIGGTRTAAHIEIDNNEIIAKSNGTTETTLYLGAGGGTVSVASALVCSKTVAVTGTTTANSHIYMRRAPNSSCTIYFKRAPNPSTTTWTSSDGVYTYTIDKTNGESDIAYLSYSPSWAGKRVTVADGTTNNSYVSNGYLTFRNYSISSSTGARLSYYYQFRLYPATPADLTANTTFYFAVHTNSSISSSTSKRYVVGISGANGGLNYNASVYTSNSILYGACWNDYAEYRKGEITEPGKVVHECSDGIMRLTTKRLEPACEIISDTFGFSIGETEECKTPIAATGRVLAYTDCDRYSFNLGDAVCSGENGTVSKMTREEIMMYPERIIGTVSEIPEYETWGTGNVAVNGRIWIRIR